MKKLLLIVISLMVLACSNAQARNSATSYDAKYYSQQEFVQAYNNSTAPIYRDYVVGLDVNSVGDTSPTINPNSNLGQYVTEATGSTTDSIFVFGVADETIPAGQLGRICIRGPHKVQYITMSQTNNNPALGLSVGTVLSQCKNAIPLFPNLNGGPAVNGGYSCPYSTATGTAGGMLGYVLNTTATTDTGDAAQTVNGLTTTGAEYWAWIDPKVLR